MRLLARPMRTSLLRKLLVVEERLQRVRERVRVAYLAVDDDPGLERDAGEPARARERPSISLHDGRSELRGADLETDDLAAAAVAAA